MAQPTAAPEVTSAADLDADTPVDVVLWNDPVSLFDHVVATLARRVPLPARQAEDVAQGAHEHGRAVVVTVPHSRAVQLAADLQLDTLTATVEPRP